MNRSAWSGSLSVTIVGTIFLVALLTSSTNSVSGNQPESTVKIDLIKNIGQFYLSSPPYFSNNSYKITKIFLENATLWVGTSITTEAKSFRDSYDTDMANTFFVNGTIRNTYSAKDIIKLSKEGKSQCLIGLDIYLFDSQGNFVNTISRGNPFRGCYEVSLISNQTANFYVDFIASSSDVASFEVYVSYLDPFPLF